MRWITGVAMFLLLSELLLELIADTKYARFARWVSGVIVLFLFVFPLLEGGQLTEQFKHSVQSFRFSIGTERIPQELYLTENSMENSVYLSYRSAIEEQIADLLAENQLLVEKTEIRIMENGELEALFVEARFLDGTNQNNTIVIPTIVPVEVGGQRNQNMVSPMELYIQNLLAEFYRLDGNKIEVVINEAE